MTLATTNRAAERLVETLELRLRIRAELAIEADAKGDYALANRHRQAGDVVRDDLASVRQELPYILGASDVCPECGFHAGGHADGCAR